MNHRAFNRNFTCQGSPFLALSLLALIGALLLMNWSVIHRWDIWQNASSAVTRLPVLSSHYCSLTYSQRFWLGGIANSIFFFFFLICIAPLKQTALALTSVNTCTYWPGRSESSSIVNF